MWGSRSFRPEILEHQSYEYLEGSSAETLQPDDGDETDTKFKDEVYPTETSTERSVREQKEKERQQRCNEQFENCMICFGGKGYNGDSKNLVDVREKSWETFWQSSGLNTTEARERFWREKRILPETEWFKREAVQGFAARNWEADDVPRVLRYVAPKYMEAVEKINSFGVVCPRNDNSAQFDSDSPLYWVRSLQCFHSDQSLITCWHWQSNPLEAPLPNAPNLHMYTMYGIGLLAERSYFYAVNGDPVRKLDWKAG